MNREQIEVAIAATAAVAEAIRELKSVPSGELYARLMGTLSIESYTAILGAIKRAGLIAESGGLLTWIGPTLEDQ